MAFSLMLGLQESGHGLTSTNRWWYSKLVFETAKAWFGNDGVSQEWSFARYANPVTVWADFITEREKTELEACAFKNQDIARYDHQVNNGLGDKRTTERYPGSVSQIFDVEKA